jgi:hypothetical protein
MPLLRYGSEHVCCWHLSDLQRRPLYGRYQGKSGRGSVRIIEGVRLDELSASMWATWTCWLMLFMSITAPQKHLDWPLASCVGSLHPESTSRISTLSSPLPCQSADVLLVTQRALCEIGKLFFFKSF